MPAELGQPFDPKFVGVPPHVSREDLPLWERWRRRYAASYRRFYFDVALGAGAPIPDGTAVNVAEAWSRLTRLRADVVGDRGDAWVLIELRPHAGPGAIGAIQSYSILLLGSLPDDRPLTSMLVTDRCSEDIKAVAGAVGIEVVCLDEIDIPGMG